MNSLHQSNTVQIPVSGLKTRPFTLNYQPIIKYRDKEPFALQASITWQDKSQSRINPNALLGISDIESPLTLSLNSFFIKTALYDLRIIQKKTMYAGSLILTIPSALAVRPDFLTLMKDIIRTEEKACQDQGVELSREKIIFQMSGTEKVGNNLEDAVSMFSDLGVGVSIGDFGLENKNFDILLNKKVDIISLSPQISSTIFSEKSSRLFIEQLMNLASYFKKKVIVDGIEHFEHVSLFSSEGYNLFKGNYFLPPRCIASIIRYIKVQERQ